LVPTEPDDCVTIEGVDLSYFIPLRLIEKDSILSKKTLKIYGFDVDGNQKNSLSFTFEASD